MSGKVYFLEPSALVKVYALKPGTDRVRAFVRSAVERPGVPGEVVVAVCDLAEAAATSAVVRKLAVFHLAPAGVEFVLVSGSAVAVAAVSHMSTIRVALRRRRDPDPQGQPRPRESRDRA